MAIPTMGLWANDVGDYTCQCWLQVIDKDTSEVWIVENGKEIARERLSTKGEDGWRAPIAWAENERVRHLPRYHAAIRKRMKEAGQI